MNISNIMTPENIKLMSQGIAFSALAVGTLFVGKRYYDNYKINKVITQTQNHINNMYSNCFTIDRLIDPDCGGKNLSLGVNGNVKPNNILSHQGIRWGHDGQIKRLVSFSKVDSGLIYNFEDNYRLTLNKTDKNKIIYSFQTDNDVIVKEINERVITFWKPISMSSVELDRITELK
jgi:hypothetical protein